MDNGAALTSNVAPSLGTPEFRVAAADVATPSILAAQDFFNSLGRAARRTWRWPRRLHVALVTVDTVIVLASVLLAQLVRFGVPSSLRAAGAETGANSYPVLGLAVAAVWLVLLAGFRSRDIRHLGSGNTEYQRVANATFATFGVVAILSLVFQLDLARGYLVVAFPVGLIALNAGRFTARRWLVRQRAAGRCLTSAFVVGPPSDVARVTAQLVNTRQAGYRPIAVAPTTAVRSTFAPVGVNGKPVPMVSLADIPTLARHESVRAVIVAGDLPGGRARIQQLGWELENTSAELILMSRLTDVAGPRIHMRPVEDLPMVHVDLPQYKGATHAVKRGLDILLAGLAVTVLAPVLAVVALAVRLDSPGPVLFRQQRIGQAGAPFQMLKFRSMVVDAEARLAELQAANEGAGLLFKMKDDPRITRIGAFLRRYSLDELPQLFNVLGGSMSLIGPRPPLPKEVAAYEGRVNRRLLIKPGITGLWQVSGRSNLTWDESIHLDLYYVENWSLTTDLVILARTLKAVLGKDGAY